MKKFSAITLPQFAAMAWPSGKTLHVDGTNGSDTKGLRGSPRAYATITAAKTAASSGDTIVVHPGTYSETDLLKTGVNYHFVEGAKVINDVSSTAIKNGTAATYAIFDDRGAAVTSRISGRGEFHTVYGESDWDDSIAQPVASNVNRRGFVNISHASSEVSIHFWRATYTGFADGGAQLVYVTNCTRVDLVGESIITLNATSSTEIGDGPSDVNGPYTITDCFGGIWWAQGEFYVNVDVIKSGLYAVYAEGSGVSATTNMWVQSSLIESTNFATIYTNGSANVNYKVWIQAKEIRASGQSNGAMNLQSNGKVYIEALKIGSDNGNIGTMVAFSATGVEYWLRAQKLSIGVTGTAGLQIGSPVGQNYPCKAFVFVQHYVDTTPGTPVVGDYILTRGTATECHIFGGVMELKQNHTGVNHVSGVTVLKGLRIETNETNDADNKCVIVAASGLTIDTCSLIAPALANAIHATSAQTVTFIGDNNIVGTIHNVATPNYFFNPATKRQTVALPSGSGGTLGAFGDVWTAFGTGTGLAPTATEGATGNYATNATTNAGAGIGGNQNYRNGRNLIFRSRVKLQENVSQIVWIGLTDAVAATHAQTDNPAGNYACFRYSTSASDATWKAITKDNTTQNINNSGVAIGTTIKLFEIFEDVANSRWIFKIDNAVVATVTTNLPTSGTNLRGFASVVTLENVAKNLRTEGIFIQSDI